MRLIAARCGTLNMDGGLLDSGQVSGVMRRIPSMCFLIEHPEGLVVWDTSMHPAVCDDPVGYWGRVADSVLIPEYEPSDTLISRLELLDIAAESVRFVLNSHLHNDHCGMNRFFPDATVLTRRCELEHAEASTTKWYSGYVANDFLGDGQHVELFDYDDRHDVFGDGALELVSTIGHTAGHQSLAVRFPSGRRFVLSGDAVYTGAQLAAGEPSGLTWDRDAAVESAGMLAAMVADGATVLVQHDPAIWNVAMTVAEVWAEDGGASHPPPSR